MANTIIYKLPFDKSSVRQAYVGAQGCACGCKGKYYYRNVLDAENWQLADKTQKGNSRGITFAYNKVVLLGRKYGINVQNGYIFSVELPTRAYRLYLR